MEKRIARAGVRRRTGGYFDWWIKDSFNCVLSHPTLVVSGFEKAREKATRLAAQAARDYNATFRPKVYPPVPKHMFKPTCAKAGEHCEGFKR